MQVRQLTGQVQQLASGFATMQAGLNEMQARLDDLAPVRSSGGGGAVSRLGGQDGKVRGPVCRTLFGLTDGLGDRNSKNATAPRCS